MLVEVCSENCAKLCHCLLLVSWFDFVAAIQKIVQCLCRFLHLFDLRKVMLHLCLLLNIVIVPNASELVHLYDLLFPGHIFIDQGFLVVFDFSEVLLFFRYQCIYTCTLGF